MSERRSREKNRVLSIIRSVRARWRLRMALRGSSIVLGAGFLAFLLSAYGLEALRFSPEAVVGLRVAAWGVVVLLTFLFLLKPLLRRVSDEQVALYLEEREPSLEASILGAVDVEGGETSAENRASPELLDRLVERAVEKARAVDYGRRIDGPGLYRGSGILAFVLFAVLLFLLLGPKGVRYGITAIALPTTEAAEVNPYSIVVSPGDVTVARGSDLLVTAELRGFDSDNVSVYSRPSDTEPHQRLSMIPADSGGYDLLLLNLLEDTEYFVEANGIRSPSYAIEVAELPYVEGMTHTYVFPAYTMLKPRAVEGGGDIAALKGTRVEMTIRSTLPTPRGLLVADDSVVTELGTQPDGTLTGELVVREDGVYRIELARSDGRMVEASPEYTIDVLDDLPPSVVISEPGRDAQASAIEEIFLEARADDDYGVGDLRIVYSVNGEGEDTLTLFREGGAPLTEVTAGQTLFLEEWALEPGDVVSYYAVARDNRSRRAEEALSDIYFINVRPFRRDFRQAGERPQGEGQQRAGQQGAPGQGAGGSLSELQREVVAATFNLLRDQESYSAEEFSENTVSVALAQGRVRDEVASLLVQMNTRGIAGSDPQFQEIANLLPVAIEDMERAEAYLREEDTRSALAPEQKALRVLQKAEESYERIVSQQQGGGGGGGGGGASAEELADLFEMELDQLQNQYETVQRGERQQADQEVDELMERLRELARRQQQELERQRRRAEAQQGAAGGPGGDSQRALAEEAEETARQLEELSRRTEDRELAETARRLREAAETMRRSAAGSGRSSGLAEATSALDELEEAQRRLERNQEGRMEESIQDALDRADRLAGAQGRVRDAVAELPEDASARRAEVGRIQDEKDEMIQETQALERDLVRMQRAAQRESPDAAAELRDAAAAIREEGLEEKLAYTKDVVEERERIFALGWEDQIASDIEELRDELESALQAFRGSLPDRELEEVLEETRDLKRGAESLERRLENRGALRPSEGRGGEAEEEGAQADEEDREGQGREGRREAQAGEARSGQEAQSGQQDGQTGTRGEGGAGEGGPPGEEGEVPRPGQEGERVQGSPFGGATRGDPPPFSEEEIRQYTREFAQRLEEARELRERMGEAGREIQDLEEAIEAFQALTDPEAYGDLPQIALLQGQIRENLRRLEFLLRREVEGESEGRAALTGRDEVPDGFRRMVEEYFKNLARDRGGGGGG